MGWQEDCLISSLMAAYPVIGSSGCCMSDRQIRCLSLSLCPRHCVYVCLSLSLSHLQVSVSIWTLCFHFDIQNLVLVTFTYLLNIPSCCVLFSYPTDAVVVPKNLFDIRWGVRRDQDRKCFQVSSVFQGCSHCTFIHLLSV